VPAPPAHYQSTLTRAISAICAGPSAAAAGACANANAIQSSEPRNGGASKTRSIAKEQGRIDLHLAEQVMQVFKEWLGLRRGEWRARLESLPRFDLNDSDASDDESTAGGQHSTSRGTHNLSMTGDMPIAQYSMAELLDLLDGALHSNAPDTIEIARWSVMIAQRTGSGRIKTSALIAVQAACRFLRRPHLFASPAQAGAAYGCPQRTCEQWVDKIEACILAEASAEAAATMTPGQAGSSSQSDGLPSACSLDEVSAVNGLVSLGDERLRSDVPAATPPPTFPPSPPGTAVPKGAAAGATPSTPKRTRINTILAPQGGPTDEEMGIDDELLAQLAPWAWLETDESTAHTSSDYDDLSSDLRALTAKNTPRGRSAPPVAPPRRTHTLETRSTTSRRLSAHHHGTNSARPSNPPGTSSPWHMRPRGGRITPA
jgi:hypothetical protein